MPPGPFSTTTTAFVVSGSSSGGSSLPVVGERPAALDVREQPLEVFRLLAELRVARLRLLAHALEAPLDMVAVGDEQLELELLDLVG